jgi:hypothetical protein
MYLLNNINSTTLFDYSYTYHYSKYSCSTDFYFIHVVFCYIIFLSGLGAFITRLHSKMKPAHQWFGRVYILSMLYATATSLLIHNTGLPLAVLYSFAICIGGLTLAWILILLHKSWLNNLALKNLYEKFKKLILSVNSKPLIEHINEEKTQILGKRNACQRLFSYKAFHGALMFMSWINITGRIFASDQSGDFQCYTYPIYKVGNETSLNQSIIEFDIVPEIDPNYDRLPWAHIENWWAVIFSVGILAVALIFGAIWSCSAVAIETSKRINKNLNVIKRTMRIT